MNSMHKFDSVNTTLLMILINLSIGMKGLKMMKNKQFYTWVYQWLFSIWFHNGISITHYNNLNVNIGFSSDANHTKIFKSMAYFHKGKVRLINESFLWVVIEIIRNKESKFQAEFIHIN